MDFSKGNWNLKETKKQRFVHDLDFTQFREVVKGMIDLTLQ